jgi:hypothetical protein
VERQQIREALDTSASMLYRVRRQLVEEGFEAVLSRKQRCRHRICAGFEGFGRGPFPARQDSRCWSRTISISTARRPVAEAKRLVERFEWHYTPKALWWRYPFLARQLARSGRIRARRSARSMPRPPHPRREALIDEIAAWERERNTHNTKSDWHFTTKDARTKLKYLYPQSD